MSDYTLAERDDAFDIMAEYPGYGEVRSYTEALGAEQIAFTWRRMPAGTGGRGSYGHRHKSQEEVYFAVSGEVTFKVNDDVFKAGAGTAVRLARQALRSVHNDGSGDAQLVLCSVRIDDPVADALPKTTSGLRVGSSLRGRAREEARSGRKAARTTTEP
jgi:mannose-6-phosphate isomerase-like protein (cupin superfamily)